MPGDNREAREALRSLLLPTRESAEQQGLSAALLVALEGGIESQDFARAIRYETETWRANGSSSILLTNIVKSFITAQNTAHSEALAGVYFTLHVELQKDAYLLSFDQASAFLSHALLIVNLAYDNKVTASQIARILSAHDQRAPFSRQTLRYVLNKLGLAAEITEEQILNLYNEDAELSVKLLADADLADCSEIVGFIAEGVGLTNNIASLLNTLISAEEISNFAPYLQMLHYQCSLTEYFDYATRDLYEFNPRGVAAIKLFDKYPAKINKAGNPFLNNAKSVEQITLAWARSKKPNYYSGAKSLYYLLSSLESLGFSARRELSSWIRLWLHRIILLHSYEPTILSNTLTTEQATKLIDFVKPRNTQSSGVIEQRIVDAAAKVYHSDEAIWKPRGLKDSVNTTNISRKKLGDCDFQNSTEWKVIAYEAHGGKLTDIYFKEHIRTLKKILPQRIEEWKSFSTVSDWSVKVIFVAHEIALAEETVTFDVEGVNVVIEATTFDDFLTACDLDKLTTSMGEYVMETLSEARVPETIRQKVSSTISE